MQMTKKGVLNSYKYKHDPTEMEYLQFLQIGFVCHGLTTLFFLRHICANLKQQQSDVEQYKLLEWSKTIYATEQA